ncbi:hypothetical protein [Methylorubrum extorquens]|jgi:hypothetical protein|uniref:Uncharacterized protein n=2 Tax=Methylorubrum extorquens TaxID=408 RepID=C5B459_METEA|nr:hypothetical protein [Methylorubrum extorquens]ACS43241.1 Hypothetical protein MexAM1_META2p0389 [Methylorubrum extorquens AM1]EHP94818.1 hypothetical protein MetexDRAFT_0356 [Methylorubrum extorquens DSM 13060]MCP1545661.1 hypothetical protein [Methylorubrum extorquens]MCP1591612.1 hypothetical protein [Methylorubrum extorquens]
MNLVPTLSLSLALGIAACLPARAETAAAQRASAMEAIRLHEVTAYAISTCRWLRRRSDPKLLERWKRDNDDVLAAAMGVVASQGGLTPARRKVVESLAVAQGSALSASPSECDALFEATRTGKRDLAALIPADRIRNLLGRRAEEAEGVLWILEERRRPDGTLGRIARRYEGADGIEDCDEGAAALGHVWTRAAVLGAKALAMDPDLWLAECLISPTDPLMEDVGQAVR